MIAARLQYLLIVKNNPYNVVRNFIQHRLIVMYPVMSCKYISKILIAKGNAY